MTESEAHRLAQRWAGDAGVAEDPERADAVPAAGRQPETGRVVEGADEVGDDGQLLPRGSARAASDNPVPASSRLRLTPRDAPNSSSSASPATPRGKSQCRTSGATSCSTRPVCRSVAENLDLLAGRLCPVRPEPG
jgi:cell division septation protein DedD